MSDDENQPAPTPPPVAQQPRPESSSPASWRPNWWMLTLGIILGGVVVWLLAWQSGVKLRQREAEEQARQVLEWKEEKPIEPSGGRFFAKRVEIPVPQYFQWDERWANEPLGPTPATLAAEGCALTSAAMVLSYYGVDTDPLRLNRFLMEREGYTPEGWIYWEKAAEYPPAKVVKEYEDLPSYWRIDENLEQGNPVIVKLKLKRTNHFVVIAGKEGYDYLTRDPGQGGEKGLYPLKELGSKIEGLRYYRRAP